MESDNNHQTSDTVSKPEIAERYQYQILDVCAALHGQTCGSGEGCHPAHELEAMAAWLTMRLGTWEPARIAAFAAYDDAVRQVATVAIAEWREHYGSLAAAVVPEDALVRALRNISDEVARVRGLIDR